MSKETFDFIAKILMLFLGFYFVIFYKSLGEMAINDRSKLLSFVGLKLPGGREINIKIAQIINLIVGSIFVIHSILSLFNDHIIH